MKMKMKTYAFVISNLLTSHVLINVVRPMSNGQLQIADFCAVARGIRCACVHRMPETEEQVCRSGRANMLFLSLTFLFYFVFPTNTSIFCLNYLVIRPENDYLCPENLPDFEI